MRDQQDQHRTDDDLSAARQLVLRESYGGVTPPPGDMVSLPHRSAAQPSSAWRFIAVSHARRKARHRAEKAARLDCSVLLLGPTGAGKDVLANDIHKAGSRRGGPFVAQGCGEIPATLFESLLYGHIRGAFTGADARRAGLVELAEGGTLFLDEIAELRPEAQTKLLRFLESKEYRSLGATCVRRADVRIIAATNRDLDALPDSVFRRDLLARVDRFRIHVPPPSPEDIPELVRAFAPEIADSTGERMESGELEDLARLAASRPWEHHCRSLQKALWGYFVERDHHRTVEERWAETCGHTPSPAPLKRGVPEPPAMSWSRLLHHLGNLIRLRILLEERSVLAAARRQHTSDKAIYQWLDKIRLQLGWPDDGRGRVPDRAVLERSIDEEKRALGPWLPWLRALFEEPVGP